jgi:general secretion pathway protein I
MRIWFMRCADPQAGTGHTEAGFTLLEALVAVSVLAVASVGLLRAAEGHVDRISQLEQRAAASWLANAVLADLRLGRATPASATGPREMAGREFQVDVTPVATDDPDLLRLEIAIGGGDGDGGGGALVQLTGFMDVGRPR